MANVAGASYKLKATAFTFKITTDSVKLAKRIGGLLMCEECPFTFDIEPQNVYRIEVARDFQKEINAAMIKLDTETEE
jgi:hypothetical protein